MRNLITTRVLFGLCLIVCVTGPVCRAQHLVKGKVTTDTSTGAPPPRRELQVLLIAKGRPPRRAAIDGRTGGFVFERVSDDKFQIVACAGKDYIPDVKEIDLNDGKPHDNILLTLIYAKANNRQDLSGPVKDKGVSIVYAVAYECQLDSALVNSQRRYEFKNMPKPPEKYAYAIETPDGKRLQSAAIGKSDKSQEIALNIVDDRPDGVPELTAKIVKAPTIDPSKKGLLAGRITDPAGAIARGVAVLITNRETNATITTKTNDSGEFAENVPMGIYDVKAEASSAVSQVENIVVASDETTLNMQLAWIATSVSVIEDDRADRLVETASGTTVFEAREVLRLPVPIRNYETFVSLVAGSTSRPADSTRAGSTSVNGSSPSATTFIVDSAESDRDPLGLARVSGPEVPFEAIQRTTISLHDQSELGRSSGGSVIVLTKSGTDDLTGSVFYWHRNSAFAARDFFDRDKSRFLTNHFGATIGGPIRNDFYYFGSYEGKRELEARPRLLSVPSSTRLASARSILLANGLAENDLSTRLLMFFPSADRDGVFNNRTINSPVINDYDNFFVRLDRRVGPASASVIYNFARTDQLYPLPPSFIRGFRTDLSGRTQSLSGVFVNEFTPYFTNEIAIRYERNRQHFRPEDHDFNPLTIGLNSGVNDSQRFGLPLIKIAGFDALGSAFELPTRQVRSSWQANNMFAYKRGAHTIRAGGEFRRAIVNSNNDAGTRGRIVFDGSVLGDPLADFLAGFPSGNTAIVRGDTHRELAMNFANVFVQDEYKTLSDLTLNLGLRYSLNSAPHEESDQLSTFIPVVGLVQIGSAQSDMLFKKDLTNFAPRVGVALDPTVSGAFAIRAGWGIYFNSPSLTLFSALCPCTNSPNAAVTMNPVGSRPTFALSPIGPVPFGVGIPIFDDPALLNLSAVETNLKNPYVQNYYGGVQYSPTSHAVLEVSYSGSVGRRLLRIIDINQPTPGDRSTRDSRRPFFSAFPQFGAINLLTSSGRSNYHALEVSLRRHVNTGLWLNTSYTLSKSIDEASNPNELPQNSRDIRAEKALSTFDQRHRFILSWIYHTGSSRKYELLKRWEIAGILRLASGNPFTPLISFDNSGTSTFADRPNLLSDPRVQGSRTQLYTSSAFGLPSAGSFGNAGRNSLLGPGLNSLDLSLKKRIPFRNDRFIEFRAEAFNLLSHPNFILPNNFIDEPAFGTVVATHPDHGRRKLQFGIRLTF